MSGVVMQMPLRTFLIKKYFSIAINCICCFTGINGVHISVLCEFCGFGNVKNNEEFFFFW